MARMVGGTNVTITKDAATDTLTWAAANTSAGITDFAEAVDDRANALIVAGTGVTKTYDDVANTLTLASSGMTNPMTTPADLIVGGTAGTPARLAKGTSGQVLTVDPTTGLLVWTTPATGGATTLDGLTDTTIATPADGQVLTYEAATTQWKNKAATGGGASTLTGNGEIYPSIQASAVSGGAQASKGAALMCSVNCTVTEVGFQVTPVSGRTYTIGLYQYTPSNNQITAVVGTATVVAPSAVTQILAVTGRSWSVTRGNQYVALITDPTSDTTAMPIYTTPFTSAGPSTPFGLAGQIGARVASVAPGIGMTIERLSADHFHAQWVAMIAV